MLMRVRTHGPRVMGLTGHRQVVSPKVRGAMAKGPGEHGADCASPRCVWVGVLGQHGSRCPGAFRVCWACLGPGRRSRVIPGFRDVPAARRVDNGRILYRMTKALERWLPLLACFALVAALLRPEIGVQYGVYDEGNTVCPAWRVAQGDLLYRDLWQMHAPGTAYLLAALFRLFGATLAVERLTKYVLLSLTGFLLYRLQRRFMGPVPAAAGTIACLAAHVLSLVLRPHDPSLLAIMASLLVISRHFLGPARPWTLPLAGLLAGIAGCFKHDFGLYLAVAASATLLGFPGASEPPPVDARRARLRALVLFHAGLALPVALVVAYFHGLGTLGEMWQQMVLFPVRSFARFRGLPPVGFLGHALWWGVPACLASAMLVAYRRRRDDRGSAVLFLMGLTGLLIFNYARVRFDIAHLRPALLFAVPLSVHQLVAVRRWLAARGLRVAERLVALGLAAGLAGFVATFLHLQRRMLEAGAPAGSVAAGHEGLARRAGGVALAEDLVRAVEYVDDHVSPGVPIFVGNHRHDRLRGSAPLFYFLAGRPGVTRYYNLHPGVATTREVQQEIVRALRDRETEWVVLWTPPEVEEPNDSARGSGVRDLDEYLDRSYSPVASYGRYEVRRRTCCEASGGQSPSAALRPSSREIGQ